MSSNQNEWSGQVRREVGSVESESAEGEWKDVKVFSLYKGQKDRRVLDLHLSWECFEMAGLYGLNGEGRLSGGVRHRGELQGQHADSTASWRARRRRDGRRVPVL